jgi:Ribonuclease G/E
MFRSIKNKAAKKGRKKGKEDKLRFINVMVHPRMSEYLFNENRNKLIQFEKEHDIKINIYASYEVNVNELRYV